MTNKITKVFSKKVSLEMIEERKKLKKEKAKVRKSQQRPREER
jgi:hypothetical protein